MHVRSGSPLLLVAAALACASGPPPPAPGTSQVWGELRVVPRVDVAHAGGGGSYGDRRLRDVELVDYSQPGFAVVYVDADEAPAGELSVTLRSSRFGVVVEPEHGAVGASGRVVVRNASEAPHLVSQPSTGAVRTLAPGEQVALSFPHPGEERLYLLDLPETSVTLFAAPGPFAVVSSSGRYTLSNLTPGSRTLHAWHPRLPATRRRLALAPGASVRVDLELGAGLPEESGDAR
jgi:hypothetical protein